MGIRSLRKLPVIAAFAIVILAVSLANPDTAEAWLAAGSHSVYPASGGKWTYGFWNAKVRSYYTVDKKHGSSVNVNGNFVRSICTARYRTSKATHYALYTPGADDLYYYRLC